MTELEVGMLATTDKGLGWSGGPTHLSFSRVPGQLEGVIKDELEVCGLGR